MRDMSPRAEHFRDHHPAETRAPQLEVDVMRVGQEVLRNQRDVCERDSRAPHS